MTSFLVSLVVLIATVVQEYFGYPSGAHQVNVSDQNAK